MMPFLGGKQPMLPAQLLTWKAFLPSIDLKDIAEVNTTIEGIVLPSPHLPALPDLLRLLQRRCAEPLVRLARRLVAEGGGTLPLYQGQRPAVSVELALSPAHEMHPAPSRPLECSEGYQLVLAGGASTERTTCTGRLVCGRLVAGDLAPCEPADRLRLIGGPTLLLRGFYARH